VERAQQRVAQHLSRLQEAFLSRPSVGRAAELTGAAALAARPEAAGDAAEFLLMHAEDTTPMALTAARRVIGLEALHLEEVAEGPAGVDAMQGELRRLRAVIREGSRSPFAHLDLARVYSTLGQRERAERHLSIALALAPQHRLILRGAARYYVHAHDPQEAVRLLRRQAVTPNDPWLIAAEISAAMVANIAPKFVRRGRDLLESKAFTPLHTSELAASLATLELTDGKAKRGRKLFEQALERPTDNALAQAQWAAPQVRLDFDQVQLQNVPRNFEALGNERYKAGEFLEARSAFMAWFMDEPFASTPAVMAGYISHLLDPSPTQAIEVTQLGLTADPDEATLLNNMAFYLASADRLDDAETYLARLLDLPDVSDISVALNATTGLLAFRRGDMQQGARLYEAAIAAAAARREHDQEISAKLYYARELFRWRDPSAPARLTEAFEAANRLGEPGVILTARRVRADTYGT
jgi:Tfp pilus assembly protein PilF